MSNGPEKVQATETQDQKQEKINIDNGKKSEQIKSDDLLTKQLDSEVPNDPVQKNETKSDIENKEMSFDESTDKLIQTIVNLKLNAAFNPENTAKGLEQTNEYRKNVLLTSDNESLKRYIAYYNAQTMINNYHNGTNDPTINMDQYMAKFEPMANEHKKQIIDTQSSKNQKLENLPDFPLATESKIGKFIQMSDVDKDKIRNKFDDIINNNMNLGIVTLVGKADATDVNTSKETISTLKNTYDQQRNELLTKGMSQVWMDKNFPPDFLSKPNPTQDELKQSYAYIRAMLQISFLEPKHINYIVKNSKEMRVSTIVSKDKGDQYTGQEINAEVFSGENSTSTEFKELFLKEFQKLQINYVVPINGRMQLLQGIGVYNNNIKDAKDNNLQVNSYEGSWYGSNAVLSQHEFQGKSTGVYKMPSTPGETLYIVLDQKDSRIKMTQKETGRMVKNPDTGVMEPEKAQYLTMNSDVPPTLDNFQKVLEDFQNQSAGKEKDHAGNLIAMMDTYRELIKGEKGTVLTI